MIYFLRFYGNFVLLLEVTIYEYLLISNNILYNKNHKITDINSHDITEILLKVALNAINPTQTSIVVCFSKINLNEINAQQS